MRNFYGVPLHLGACGSQLSHKENTVRVPLVPKEAASSKTCLFFLVGDQSTDYTLSYILERFRCVVSSSHWELLKKGPRGSCSEKLHKQQHLSLMGRAGGLLSTAWSSSSGHGAAGLVQGRFS